MSDQLKVVNDIPENLFNLYQQKKLVAVDSELHGLKLYRDEVCLVQLCDDDKNVCLVQPQQNHSAPPRLKQLMEDENVLKLFHFALSDVGFFKTSLKIEVKPFICTKVMSKLVRTYTGSHGLKDLVLEFTGVKMDKEQQQTNWARTDLSPEQLHYAANDVLYLVDVYQGLNKMIEERPALSTGVELKDLHQKAQAMIPSLVDLLIHGYGDGDMGWKTTLFEH